jgi:hypothetical protein
MSRFLLPLVLACLQVFAPLPANAGGDYVGNGGGLAEKNILFAWNNVAKYARLCLDVSSCRLSQAERELLADIEAAMKKELKSDDPIQFVSEKKQPGFFRIDGEIKVAKTGSKIGSVIYVNKDMIYTKNAFDQIEPMSIASALAMLIHEVGHHVSKASHEALDLLGVKVSMFLQNQIQTTPFLPWSDQISATIVQSTAMKSFPQILLNVGDEVLDMSQAFHDTVFCPEATIPILILPFPDIQVGGRRPEGTLYHNVHWERSEREGLEGNFTILGNLTHICPADMQQIAGVNSFVYRISFSTIEQDGKPKLRQETIRLEQAYEPWYKVIKF